MFSKACQYGIKATIYVASKSIHKHIPNLKEISNAIHSPVAFTAKILQSLVHFKIIDSIKGSRGGFTIPIQRLQTLQLSRIVYSIDGDHILNNCALGLQKCSEANPCPIHPKYKIVKSNIENMLEGTLVVDLLNDLSLHETVLVN